MKLPPLDAVRSLIEDEVRRQIRTSELTLQSSIDESADRIIAAIQAPGTVYPADGVSRQYAQTDGLTRALVTIGYGHHELHGGSYFDTWAQANGTSLIIAFRTPPGKKHGHLEATWKTEDSSILNMYRGRTWTTGTGTLLTPMNRNHTSDKTSVMLGDQTGAFVAGQMVANPTGGAGGTLYWSEDTYATNQSTAFAQDRNERVHDDDETYLIEVLSAGGAQEMWLGIGWYEHTDN